MTPLQRHLENEEMMALGWVKEDGSPSDMAASMFKSTTQGATTSLWCATNSMLSDIGGVFCENCDVAVLKKYLNIDCEPIYCTKIVSKLVRTYTDRHGLKDLCRELIGVDLSKQQQSSNWGAKELTEEQKHYAASDVLYLHQLKDLLDQELVKLNRKSIADECFSFIKTRVDLDLKGWPDIDIFSH